ncbi:hypothetical protein Q3G72_028832 [Acer saccharum]|nr:hypothetical protein Q3G72_028832 [Acer saccharum]
MDEDWMSNGGDLVMVDDSFGQRWRQICELELKKNVSTIGELLKKLQSRKETIEPYLNTLFLRLSTMMEPTESIFGNKDAECSDLDDKGKMVASSAIGVSGVTTNRKMKTKTSERTSLRNNIR